MQELLNEIERQKQLALIPDYLEHIASPCAMPELRLLDDIQLDEPVDDVLFNKPLDFEDTATEGEILP